MLTVTVHALLGEAQEKLVAQCHCLFAWYPHALRTIAIATAGDYEECANTRFQGLLGICLTLLHGTGCSGLLTPGS